MAEEKKSVKRTRKKSTSTRRKTSTKANTSASKQGFSLRKEIRGLLLFAFALVGFIGYFGIDMGFVGDTITGFFRYGFGLGGVVVAAFFLYLGWRIFYKDTWPSINRRRLGGTFLFLLLLSMITLLGVDYGKELEPSYFPMNGGLLGGLLAFALRTVFGNVGSIFLNIVGIIAAGIVFSNKSLRRGIHLTKDKAQPHIDAAKEAAVDKAYEVRERFEEWNEERKERRAIYNQAKDEGYHRDDMNLGNEEVLIETKAESLADRATATPITAATTAPTTEPISDYSSLADSFEDDQPYGQDRTEDDFEDESNPMDYDDTGDYMDTEASVPAEPFVTGRLSQAGVQALVQANPVDTSTEMQVNPSPASRSITAPPIEPVAVEDVPVQPLAVPGTVDTSQDMADVRVSKDGEVIRRIETPYHYPSLEILAKGPERPASMGEEVAHNAAVLEETLKSFGLSAKVINATQGPTVTRYEIQPAPGTRVSKIVNLTDDLKMALAATDIRMEAPIPGKSAVGIEVPNKTVAAVHLRDVLDCEDFKKATGGIPVGLGKDISGKPVITDLAKMPHLLVAGSTGSGKSVCINTIISSILFNRKPDEVKLILIDPKMVELSVYNDIPHLMAPVVTDMKKASAVLRWAVREMESRYLTFSTLGVRKLEEYNKRHPDKAMPLILIVIDEMADLMMTAPADIEESIVRLAQKARAAGIHMILATQRPSVNVITGLIKANVPSRISFAVATQIDSRTILDMAGAEKLLGKGDMLFNPIGASKPVRIQGAFISDDEVEELVHFVKEQGRPSYNDEVTKEEAQEESAHEDKPDPMQDELLERAVDLIMETGQASVSMLQRRFRIGYTRAARLVDMMEDMKIVGPSNGAKARDILMTPAQVKEIYFNQGSSHEDGQV